MSTDPRPPSLLSRLASFFGVATKANPSPAQLYPPGRGQASQSPGYISFPGWDVLEQRSGTTGTGERFARTALTSSWVYSSIAAIAREIGSAELIVKERTDDGLQDIDNHPLERRWDAPNPHMGQSFLMQFWTWQLLLYGEAYLYVIPSRSDDTIAEFWPVPSSMIAPLPSAKEFIDAYGFTPSRTQPTIRIPPEYIIYSHLPNPFDVRRGLSPLAAAMVAIEGDLAMAKWNTNFFAKDNAAPTGLITVPKDMLDGDIDRVRMELRDFFGGSSGRRVAVARAGDMAWTPFDRSQKEMEFLQGRQFARDEISRIFGIPEGFWAKDATRANAEGAKATLIENAVWPHLVMLQEDINAQLVRSWYPGESLVVQFEDIRPRNRALELQELTTNAPYLTLDEIRAAIGYDPIGDYRGTMMADELKKGAPLPMTPASLILEAALAQAEADADAEASAAPAPQTPPDAPSGGEPMDSAPMPDASADAAQEPAEDVPPDTLMVEFKRWQRKATKALLAGRSPAGRFVSDIIPSDIARSIDAALTTATTPEAIKAIFAPMRHSLPTTGASMSRSPLPLPLPMTATASPPWRDELFADVTPEAIAWAKAAMT